MLLRIPRYAKFFPGAVGEHQSPPRGPPLCSGQERLHCTHRVIPVLCQRFLCHSKGRDGRSELFCSMDHCRIYPSWVRGRASTTQMLPLFSSQRLLDETPNVLRSSRFWLFLLIKARTFKLFAVIWIMHSCGKWPTRPARMTVKRGKTIKFIHCLKFRILSEFLSLDTHGFQR